MTSHIIHLLYPITKIIFLPSMHLITYLILTFNLRDLLESLSLPHSYKTIIVNGLKVQSILPIHMTLKNLPNVSTFYLPLCLINFFLLHIHNTSLKYHLSLNHTLMKKPYVTRTEIMPLDTN